MCNSRKPHRNRCLPILRMGAYTLMRMPLAICHSYQRTGVQRTARGVIASQYAPYRKWTTPQTFVSGFSTTGVYQGIPHGRWLWWIGAPTAGIHQCRQDHTDLLQTKLMTYSRPLCIEL